MSTLDVPGARLYHETHGTGPLLVMVPGASGVADSFGPVAPYLAARYTVLVYDRRGFSRSRLVGPQDHDRRLNTDADDVRRLVERIGDGPATVFGASSGALVALATLTHHPSAVRTVIPFEPPAVRLLSDGQRWIDAFADAYELYRRSGAEPALTTFRERTFPVSDQRIMAHAPKHGANTAYWFEHELRQYPRADLDLDALAGRADRIVPAAGRDGAGFPAHDATLALATRLGRSVLDLPGGHVGFLSHPAEYARALLDALGWTAGADRGRDPGGMNPSDWNDTYARTPHWDLGRPQPAFRRLAESGAIRGRVLDVGCGTGEHVLLAAGLGLDATGVDIAPAALSTAEAKARDRGLTARFLRHDAMALADLAESFDTVLDSGLFHIFGDADRTRYLRAVRSVLRPDGRYFVLCFSDTQPGHQGPRRITRDDITTTFAVGWRLDIAERTTLDSPTDLHGLQGWLIGLTRTS